MNALQSSVTSLVEDVKLKGPMMSILRVRRHTHVVHSLCACGKTSACASCAFMLVLVLF